MKSIVLIALLLLAGAIAKKTADDRNRKTPEPEGLGAAIDEDLAFPSKNATIAGTLKRPNVSRLCPVVVLVAGGGPNKRNDSRVMNALAEELAANGIASLRYDKRGLGQSTGDLATFTSADLADDVRAAIEFLKDRADIDPTKIGLIGHSEGGTIVQRVAAMCDDVAFVVALAPPELPGNKFFESQLASLLKAQGADEAEIKRQVELLQKEQAILISEPNDKAATESCARCTEQRMKPWSYESRISYHLGAVSPTVTIPKSICKISSALFWQSSLATICR